MQIVNRLSLLGKSFQVKSRPHQTTLNHPCWIIPSLPTLQTFKTVWTQCSSQPFNVTIRGVSSCAGISEVLIDSFTPLHADSHHPTSHPPPPSGPDDPLFTDLSSLKVVGRLRVQHEDDSPLAVGEKVSCVNLFPESLWSQINVFVSGVPCSDHGRMVNMKSYIQKQFSTSHEVKSSSLQNEFYVGDMISLGGGWEDVTTERLEQDEGLKARGNLISESRDVNFCFKPCFDLANCERAFPPGYTLTLEFERSDPNFSLLAADSSIAYKIRIYEIALEVCMRISWW